MGFEEVAGLSLKGELQDLYYAISADIEHGECFYDKDMFDDFIKNLDKMKETAYWCFYENQKEDDEGGDY